MPKWDDEARDRSQRRGSFGSAYRRDSNSRIVYSDDAPVAAPVPQTDQAQAPPSMRDKLRVVRSFAFASFLVGGGIPRPRIDMENGRQVFIFHETDDANTGRLGEMYRDWKTWADEEAQRLGAVPYLKGRGA